MKLLSIISGILFTAVTASAYTVNINQLSCSGVGPVTGYTTINLISSNKVSISSVKYFVTSSDSNVSITNKEILTNGNVRLTLYSSKFGSGFYLQMSGPVGPAQLITGGGTDVLNCQSNITAN